jgi:hypothetical protein
MASSWEDLDEESVPLPPAKVEEPPRQKWTEENVEGFREEKKRLEKLAEIHPHYAAQKDNMPTVIIKKREPKNEEPKSSQTNSPSSPVLALAFLLLSLFIQILFLF